MRRVLLLAGLSLALPTIAAADWRYLILNEPLDEPVNDRPAQAIDAPAGGTRMDDRLTIVMNGNMLGLADVIRGNDGRVLISGAGARAAGLGFGPGGGTPEPNYFYAVEDLRPAVSARIDGDRLLLQTGVDTAAQRTPGIERAERLPAVQPIAVPRQQAPPLYAEGPATMPLDDAATARLPQAPAMPVSPRVANAPTQHSLPWPAVLDQTPTPAPTPRSDSRLEEVLVTVDGDSRGVAVARIGDQGLPYFAVQDLATMRIDVPDHLTMHRDVPPEALAEQYSYRYDPAARQLDLQARNSSSGWGWLDWLRGDNADDDADTTTQDSTMQDTSATDAPDCNAPNFKRGRPSRRTGGGNC